MAMHPIVSIFIDGKEVKDCELRLISVECLPEGMIISLSTKKPSEAEPPVELAEVWR